MRFIVPINEVVDGGSQTIHVVDTGSDCRRTNRRKLREYFLAMGVKVTELKKVMRAMGFVGEGLGK